MTPRKRPSFYPRWAMLAVALLLPAASLLPLGSLWLWQHGYVLYWALGTCLTVLGVYVFQKKLLDPTLVAPAEPGETAPDPGNAEWTPRQALAWDDVLGLAARATPERMASRDAILGLAVETIEAVARRLHPERRDPLLQFTVPEALAVIERSSANLRRFLVTSFPLGDRVTVAQAMWLYRWRGALDLAEKGYDLWRVVRLLNPASAVTQELRERFTRQMYQMGREHVARRLASAFVKEVGRAAIDLYGGNLRIAPDLAEAHVSKVSREDLSRSDVRAAEPVRILVAGQTGSGKSSLVNALANEVQADVDVLPSQARFTAHRLSREGLPTSVLIIDSPGLADERSLPALVAAADDCDMIVWVTSATRAARDVDAGALAAIRQHFDRAPDRRRPPILAVITHIDGLRPFNEWEPPYDLSEPVRPKSRSIRGAIEAVSGELGIAVDRIVPVRAGHPPYNVETAWAQIIALMPEAQRARLLRTLEDMRSAPYWRSVLAQAINAGRVVGGTLLARSEDHGADERRTGRQGQ